MLYFNSHKKNPANIPATKSFILFFSYNRMSLKLLTIKPSTDAEKKYMAVFERDGRQLTTHFGAKGMSDMTQHGDPERRLAYLKRHRVTENWDDPTSAGALSRWILWETPSLRRNIELFKRRFRL